MSKRYRDEIAMVCHEMMTDFYEVGGVSDAEMKKFEEGCFITDPDPVQTEHSHREKELAYSMP
jgi:hypothetical protein